MIPKQHFLNRKFFPSPDHYAFDVRYYSFLLDLYFTFKKLKFVWFMTNMFLNWFQTKVLNNTQSNTDIANNTTAVDLLRHLCFENVTFAHFLSSLLLPKHRCH